MLYLTTHSTHVYNECNTTAVCGVGRCSQTRGSTWGEALFSHTRQYVGWGTVLTHAAVCGVGRCSHTRGSTWGGRYSHTRGSTWGGRYSHTRDSMWGGRYSHTRGSTWGGALFSHTR